jgi:hypothetical protein
MWTNLGDENSVKVPYVAKLAAARINNPKTPDGGENFDARNSIVILNDAIISDDCARTNIHFTKLRALLERYPIAAIIGPQCSEVARGILTYRDPTLPATSTDKLFPLTSIPVISYAATDNDLSCPTTCIPLNCTFCPTVDPLTGVPSQIYPNFVRVNLPARSEMAAMLTTINRYGWRRVGVVYSDDAWGREAYKQFDLLAPRFSQRIEFVAALNASILSDISYVSKIQQLAIVKMQNIGVSVVVLLMTDTLPYVQNFMQAAFVSKYYGFDPVDNVPIVQYVLPSTFMDALADIPNPIARPWATSTQGHIFVMPNIDFVGNAIYSRLINYMTLFNITIPGASTPKNPGTLGPFVYDAVQLFGNGIGNQLVCNISLVLVLNLQSVNAPKDAQDAVRSTFCASLPAPVTQARQATPDHAPSYAGLTPFLHASPFLGATGMVVFSLQTGQDAFNDRIGINNSYVLYAYSGNPSDYGSGTQPSFRTFLGYIDNATESILSSNAPRWNLELAANTGQSYHVPITACSRGSVGSPDRTPSGQAVTKCTPCDEGQYGPHGAAVCQNCPVSASQQYLCVFAGSTPFPIDVFWYNKSSVQVVPVRAGRNMSPQEQDKQIDALKIEFGAAFGVVILVGVCILMLPRVRQYQVGEWLRLMDFNQTWHPSPMNAPLVYKTTAIGGFATLSYMVIGAVVLYFLLTWFDADKYRITQSAENGMGAMGTTPQPFTFNFTFVSIDNLADCNRLCQQNVVATVPGSFKCTTRTEQSSCQLTFTSDLKTASKPTLPAAWSVSLNYANARCHGFHFNASGIKWLGTNYGVNFTLMAAPSKVFTGRENESPTARAQQEKN